MVESLALVLHGWSGNETAEGIRDGWSGNETAEGIKDETTNQPHQSIRAPSL